MSHTNSSHRILPVILVLLLVGLGITTLPADAPADPTGPAVLDHSFVGFLHVQFNCSMPQFQSSAQMDVHIARDGTVTITDTEMSYGGSEDLQDGCVYERTGTWSIMPIGIYMSGPPEHIAVDENIVFSEHITMICPPPVGVVMDESPTGNLNGGLAFDFIDAQLDGAVVEVNNGPGDLIRWTLGLVVELPSERSSWSAIKVRYAD